jgi:DNA-binding response OmpR family regulator
MTTVLIVEDEPDILVTARLILEPAGYAIIAATSAEEGLSLLELDRPDVILLDIRLPEMDGLEFLNRVRHSGSDVPIIMMSAHSSGDMLRRAVNEGSNAYLLKPFRAEELLEVLETVLVRGGEPA